MKRLLHTLTLCAALQISGSAMANSINVRLQMTHELARSGTLLAREAGSVIFQPSAAGQPALRIPDVRIENIQFPESAIEDGLIQQLYSDGQYSDLADRLSALLAPYQDYLTLPSNLNQKTLYWMEAAFWSGDYHRTQELAHSIERLPSAAHKQYARFYRGLTTLAAGDFAATEAFMAEKQADELYPTDSAARLYIEARLLEHQGKPDEAIRRATRLMALHSRDTDWMPQAELLCARLYLALDMPESAQAVLADIRDFYSENATIQKQAAALAADQ